MLQRSIGRVNYTLYCRTFQRVYEAYEQCNYSLVTSQKTLHYSLLLEKTN
jgi:hypothetical protein